MIIARSLNSAPEQTLVHERAQRGVAMADSGTLMKFGQRELLTQLQNEGLLYMNNLPYFWKIEDEALRGDPFDCVSEVARGPRISLTLPDGKAVVMEGEWTLRMHPHEPEKINIFCMYALRPGISFPVDESNFALGDHVLVLLNPVEFMRRVESTLRAERIEAKGDLVEYVPDEYVGKVGPFKKRKRFAYQSEWRFVCLGGPGGPRQLRIGSIADISILLPSVEVNKEIRVEFEEPPELVAEGSAAGPPAPST